MEKWVLEAKRADFYGLAERFHLDPVIIRLMVNRGINTEEKIEQYLHGRLEQLPHPRQMKDAERAAFLVQKTIARGESIVIASDFDVDGIFSGMILYSGLCRLGAEVSIKTPHRVKEGYGLNRRIVEEAVREKAGLLITCDNGIAAFEALELAHQCGLTVVVTDHHEVAYEEDEHGRRYLLPVAAAIVNPHQPDCRYPFKGLCGAGVAYKLIQLLYEQAGIAEEELYSLLEYVAIATVADVMDLQDENRILVKEGLKRLSKTKNHGLQALMRVNQLDPSRLSAYHIGFVLGPCFNAAGRLETTEPALQLLQAKNQEDAQALAEKLKALNDSRKEMTENGTQQAAELIENSSLKDDKVLVVALADCHESLAGIIAGRLKERYHKPVIVLTEVEDGYKGSGRSIEAYHMFDHLQVCRPLMTRFGGHAMAAGLSLPRENLPLLRRQLNEQCGLTKEDLVPVVRIDVAMPIDYIREDLIRQLEVLEPFGKGNPKPLFAERRFFLRRFTVVGRNRKIIKLVIANESGAVMDAVYFGDVERFQEEAEAFYGSARWQKLCRGEYDGLTASFSYYPSVNEYMGCRSIQITIQNYRFLS